MKALTNATFTNFGLRKFTTFSHFQISFLHLIFIYLKSVTDVLPIDINFTDKINGYTMRSALEARGSPSPCHFLFMRKNGEKAT